MIDLAIDPRTRKLILPPRPIDGAERVAQSIGIALRTWRPEWFLDKTEGVPYLDEVLGKNKREEIVEAVIRAQILMVDGVRSITKFTISVDDKTRKAFVDYEVDSNEGIAKGRFSLRG